MTTVGRSSPFSSLSSRLLMGLPLCQRSAAADALERKDLDRHLAAVAALMPELYGDSEACRQAKMELDLVVELEGEESLECKRAALLFTLAREKELGLHFARAAKAVGSEDDLRLVEGWSPYFRLRFQAICRSDSFFCRFC